MSSAVDGKTSATNFWSHGADARTIFPQMDVPKGLVPELPKEIDARIEIVWPHDDAGNAAPVAAAGKVNVAVDLYAHGSPLSVPLHVAPVVRLFRALNAEPATAVGIGRKTQYTAGSLTYPRWEFNDIDVRKAQDPANKYYFRVVVDGVMTYSNVWSHGVDARTYFPEVDKLARGR